MNKVVLHENMTREELLAWLQESKKDLVDMLDRIIPLCKNNKTEADSFINETLQTLEELEQI